ncbi:MAG: PilN domain-containing protein, partial [Acetobacteraceae bacterium]|nr:PilN domain-containing protein [Acetobacteraceae bacterium]
MLAELLGWWTARMSELLPARTEPWGSGWGNSLIVDLSGPNHRPALFLVRRRGRETPASAQDIDGVAGLARRYGLLLRVPSSVLLERDVFMPEAASHDIGALLYHEMDRLTPFDPASVLWTWSRSDHDRHQRKLRLRLSLIPRQALQPTLGALEEAGLAASGIEAVQPDGTSRVLRLHSQDQASAGWQRRAVKGLAWACVALAIAVIGLPFLLQSLALARVDEQIAVLQPSVDQVQSLRRRMTDEGAGQDAMAKARAASGDVIVAIAAITAILPDDTFLTDLSLRQRTVSMTGQSAAAPKLITALAAGPGLRNPVFAAPVTHNGSSGKD